MWFFKKEKQNRPFVTQLFRKPEIVSETVLPRRPEWAGSRLRVKEQCVLCNVT